MKKLLALSICLVFAILTRAQEEKKSIHIPDPTQKTEVVKAACGQCVFGMSGNDCTLAVKIKNKTYFVVGTGVDDHGDAHAKDGFCNKVRKAEIQGALIENKYHVTYFKLIDQPKENSH